MAKLPEDRGTPEQYEETVHPDNPPRASAAPAAAIAGIWYILGPLALIIMAVVMALWFMFGGDPEPAEQARTLPGVAGTGGDGDTGVVVTDSGIDSTRDELEYRGADDGVLGPAAALTIGDPVALESAEVVEVGNGADFWIDHGGQRVAVVAPQDAPELRPGMEITLTGTVEGGAQDGVRIRATEVAVR